MKIGFDLHGVLTEAPEILKPILMALRLRGDEIYVLSGPPRIVIEAELKKLRYFEGVHYDHLFSMIDYAREKGHEIWEKPKGHYWCDDKIWWTLKGKCCHENEIEILFDDRPEYRAHLPINTTFFQTEKVRCTNCGCHL